VNSSYLFAEPQTGDPLPKPKHGVTEISRLNSTLKWFGCLGRSECGIGDKWFGVHPNTKNGWTLQYEEIIHGSFNTTLADSFHFVWMKEEFKLLSHTEEDCDRRAPLLSGGPTSRNFISNILYSMLLMTQNLFIN